MNSPESINSIRRSSRALLCGVVMLPAGELPLGYFVQHSAYFLVGIIAGVIVILLFVYTYHLRSEMRKLSLRLHELTTTDERKMTRNHEKEIEDLLALVSPLSHDLNNIAASIMGYASLLKHKLHPGTKEFHYTEQIEDSSKQAVELVEHILGFSQSDTKTIEVVDLNRLAGDAAEEFMSQSSMRKYTVLLSTESQPVPVKVSIIQFRKVILDILENAADSMESGGTINCSVGLLGESRASMYFPSGQSGCFVEIEDHGTGMDEETKQMVFTPFFTTKEREKHMGLSLSQAFRVVKQQGGSILIESSPGIGTRVKVCLPLSEGRAVAPEESTSKMSRADATKILVVDDEENVRQLGHDVLTEHGFHVITANDGVHALQKVKENPDIRLVLMDMIMPVMNGKEACVEIKKLANPPKILICTGFSELSDLKTILGTCAEGMIEKPYKTTELIEAVENILKGTIL